MLRKLGIAMLGVSVLALAGCGNQKVEMSFDDAHAQFNKQLFGDIIAAQDAILGFDYSIAKEELELSVDSSQIEGQFSVVSEVQGSLDAVEGDIAIALNGSESASQMSLDATLSMLIKMVDGALYVDVQDSSVSLGQDNPIAAMIDATLKQLSNTWIAINWDDLATLIGQPIGQNPFDPTTIKAAADFVIDAQRLVVENNLFAQKGDEREDGGKVAYDVAFNIEGITAIVQGIMQHPYIVSSMQANGQVLTEEDMQQLMTQLPLILASIELDAFVKVLDEDNIQLVINRIGTPGTQDGLVDSIIDAKKASINVHNADGSQLLTASIKGDTLKATMFQTEDVVLADAEFHAELDYSDTQVVYDMHGDVNIYAIPFVATNEDPLIISLSYDLNQSKSDDPIAVAAPETSESIITIIENLGLNAQPTTELDETYMGDE